MSAPEFPRPFGVPPLPDKEMPNESVPSFTFGAAEVLDGSAWPDSYPSDLQTYIALRIREQVEAGNVEMAASRAAQTAEGYYRRKPAALAGPESAAEHLRNALQVIDGQLNHWSGIARQAGVRPEAMVSWFEDIAAVRRRVAAALALLEGK